jgi:hypothetical protein
MKKEQINNIHHNTTIWTKYGVDDIGRNNTAAEIYEQTLFQQCLNHSPEI